VHPLGPEAPPEAASHQWLCNENPQAAAARTNSRDCSSIVLGKTRTTPSISLITPTNPAMPDGTEVLGSPPRLPPGGGLSVEVTFPTPASARHDAYETLNLKRQTAGLQIGPAR